MAVCEIWDVRGRLDHPIDYAENPEKTANPNYSETDLQALVDVMEYATNQDKTEQRFFVTGVNCDPASAREEMMIAKAQWNDESEIICYHGFQSFKSGEVTPKQAHEIGVRLAQRMWGDRFQVIVATHLNTDCLHNHFVVNRGFMRGKKEKHISVYALFDNEEVGSGTAQGAGSPFLATVLQRLSYSLGFSYDETMAMTAGSFMISADNAHSVHPNHPEYADPVNRPVINGGIVIKYNAQQRYATDGLSAARFKELCRDLSIPVQTFTNRSDNPGGSTLGNISNTKVSMPTVDIGLAQLAMHSSYETAGTLDTAYLVNASIQFFD